MDQTVMEHINPFDMTTMIKSSKNNSISANTDQTDYRRLNTLQWEEVSKVKQAIQD